MKVMVVLITVLLGFFSFCSAQLGKVIEHAHTYAHTRANTHPLPSAGQYILPHMYIIGDVTG